MCAGAGEGDGWRRHWANEEQPKRLREAQTGGSSSTLQLQLQQQQHSTGGGNMSYLFTFRTFSKCNNVILFLPDETIHCLCPFLFPNLSLIKFCYCLIAKMPFIFTHWLCSCFFFFLTVYLYDFVPFVQIVNFVNLHFYVRVKLKNIWMKVLSLF